jgi:riboflavin kinase/FMN adenylyltransferase
VNIYTNLSEINNIKRPVLTIGTYDGVHLGHQKILNFLKQKAKEVNGESVVFTFYPHPRMVLHPNDHNLELLQTIDERIEKLSKIGIDHLIVFPFNKAFSRLSAVEFVRDVLVNQINIHTLVVGYDHQFGRNREGTKDVLNELAPIYNFNVVEIPAFLKDEVKISSTKIRTALKNGQVEIAKEYLGEYYSIQGKVVQGDKIGTKIGFPTANIYVKEDYKLIPAKGVYAVKATINNCEFSAMLNIGYRPTISDVGEKRIEVHIFDFNKDVYNHKIKVEFVKMIRKEKTFSNLEELKQQLILDENKCRTILGDFSYSSTKKC